MKGGKIKNMKKYWIGFENSQGELKQKPIIEKNRDLAWNVAFEMCKELQEQTHNNTWVFRIAKIEKTDAFEPDYFDCIKCERVFCICGS
jgi:hypothetical protein